jgi:type IV secretory pathway VirB6-like protein
MLVVLFMVTDEDSRFCDDECGDVSNDDGDADDDDDTDGAAI